MNKEISWEVRSNMAKSDGWFAENVMNWHSVSNEWRDDNDEFRGSIDFRGYYEEAWSPTRNLRDTFEVVTKIISDGDVEFILSNKFTMNYEIQDIWMAHFFGLDGNLLDVDGFGVFPQDAICDAIVKIYYPIRMKKIEP